MADELNTQQSVKQPVSDAPANRSARPYQQTDGKKDSGYIEKVVFINRVTKVTKGGKNMSFSALVVVGDGSGQVGYALGKANEVADAIRKGVARARKSMVKVNVKGTTISHEINANFGSVNILLKPAAPGTGVIASSPVRAICDCAGIHDILTKNLAKSCNPINVVKATFNGLLSLKG